MVDWHNAVSAGVCRPGCWQDVLFGWTNSRCRKTRMTLRFLPNGNWQKRLKACNEALYFDASARENQDKIQNREFTCRRELLNYCTYLLEYLSWYAGFKSGYKTLCTFNVVCTYQHRRNIGLLSLCGNMLLFRRQSGKLLGTARKDICQNQPTKRQVDNGK